MSEGMQKQKEPIEKTSEEAEREKRAEQVRKKQVIIFKAPTPEQIEADRAKKEQENNRIIELRKKLRISQEKEQVENISALEKQKSKKEKDREDFLSFYKGNKEELDKIFKVGFFDKVFSFLKSEKDVSKKEKLEDFIYKTFYSGGEIKYSKEADAFKELRIIFEDGYKEFQYKKPFSTESEIIGKDKDGKNIFGKKIWLWAHINEGPKEINENMGRFYLNLKPEKMHSFFKKASSEFINADLSAALKIPIIDKESSDESAERTLNRPDKMVVYFGKREDEKTLSVLRDLYENNKDDFDGGSPRFTSELKDTKGEKMIGVGFGQEPFRFEKGESFGSIRSKVLVDALEIAYKEGSQIDENNFDEYFEKACIKNKVDPSNPAFNADSEGKFEVIRKAAA